MKYKNFKSISLSTLGMGNMRLPKAVDGSIDWIKAHEVIDSAYKSGINYFDTAYVYNNGESEKCLGNCLNKFERSTYYIADKFNIMANPDYVSVFNEQLERLDKTYIDFYLCHCLLDNNIDQYLNSGCIEYFDKLKKEGKIKYLGFSSHASVETLKRMLEAYDWDFVQIQFNYYDYLYSSSKEEYDVIASKNIPIMVMEPIRGGKLSDLTTECKKKLREEHPEWSDSSWALRFVKSFDNVQVILSGMSDLNQVSDNVKTFSDSYLFTERDRIVIENVCKDYRNQIVVPCTSCQYCVDDCPRKINIPEYFKGYNSYKINGDWHLKDIINVESDGKPIDCIKCGKCMKKCPQHIEIPKYIEKISEIMEKTK